MSPTNTLSAGANVARSGPDRGATKPAELTAVDLGATAKDLLLTSKDVIENPIMSEQDQLASHDELSAANGTGSADLSTDVDDEFMNDANKWRKIGALVILTVVNLLNYIDRFTIAGVLTLLQKDFDMNDAQGGLLQTIFICFYMVFAPICGYLGDRYNRKRIMIVGLSVWTLAVLGSSFIPSHHFVLLLLLRGIVGVGEASYSTVAPTLIADMFKGKWRSRGLMLFYFAIPVGSGLGYIVGSTIADVTNTWRWGVRVTPICGIVCLLLIIFLLVEPERGASDHAHTKTTTFVEDLKELANNRTYVYATLGYTGATFVAGSMSWWTPATVEHAYAMRHGLITTPDDQKAAIALIFGVITCLAGFGGVATGSITAQMWRDGRGCLRRFRNQCADPYVCAIGSLSAVPLFFITLQLFAAHEGLAWISTFITITFLCLNWAVVVDMMMYIVVPSRRSTATAFQILISHLLGDASSPYIIGAVSDRIRGSDDSAFGHYYSLQRAMYIPNFMLVVSGGLFLMAASRLIHDKRKAEIDMHASELLSASTTSSSGNSPLAYENSADSTNSSDVVMS